MKYQLIKIKSHTIEPVCMVIAIVLACFVVVVMSNFIMLDYFKAGYSFPVEVGVDALFKVLPAAFAFFLTSILIGSLVEEIREKRTAK